MRKKINHQYWIYVRRCCEEEWGLSEILVRGAFLITMSLFQNKIELLNDLVTFLTLSRIFIEIKAYFIKISGLFSSAHFKDQRTFHFSVKPFSSLSRANICHTFLFSSITFIKIKDIRTHFLFSPTALFLDQPPFKKSISDNPF